MKFNDEECMGVLTILCIIIAILVLQCNTSNKVKVKVKFDPEVINCINYCINEYNVSGFTVLKADAPPIILCECYNKQDKLMGRGRLD